jgi:hypothetical protein
MTTGGYEAAEAGARTRAIMERAIMESARAHALAKASQVITTAAADETEPLVLMAPGRLLATDPRWADYLADVERIRGLSPADLIAQRIESDPASQHALEQMAVRVRETGVRDDSSPMLLLLVVLVWLIAVGFPMVQAELPGKAQGIAVNEVATVALALAITWRVLDKRNKSD